MLDSGVVADSDPVPAALPHASAKWHVGNSGHSPLPATCPAVFSAAGPVGRVLVPKSGHFQLDLKGQYLQTTSAGPWAAVCRHDGQQVAASHVLHAPWSPPQAQCPALAPTRHTLHRPPHSPGILYETEAVPLPCTLALVHTKNAGSELVRRAACRSLGRSMQCASRGTSCSAPSGMRCHLPLDTSSAPRVLLAMCFIPSRLCPAPPNPSMQVVQQLFSSVLRCEPGQDFMRENEGALR